jgi:hypothetical protein
MPSPTLISVHALTLDIGGIPILVRTDSADFAHLLEDRYGEFVTAGAPQALMELDIELVKESDFGRRTSDFGPPTSDPRLPASEDADLSVRRDGGRWVMERGDFRAEWDPQSRRGWVRQTANPYSIDGVLRILHSLILARHGGFLVHAASAVRNGRAFVFAGVSGAGKTTLARLAPPDVTLLTDEISYVRAGAGGWGLGARENPPEPSPQSPAPGTQPLAPAFAAFGTPFAGELARIGQKVQAPLATLFLLKQGPENRIEPLSEGQAARELLRHVLFFARDEELVRMVFQTVCDFVRRVPVRRLVFTPDTRVWEMIG